MNDEIFKVASSKLGFKYYAEIKITGNELNVYYGYIEVSNEEPTDDLWFKIGFTYAPGNLQFMMSKDEIYKQYNNFILKNNK